MPQHRELNQIEDVTGPGRESKATQILENAVGMLIIGEYTLFDTWQTKNNLLFEV